MCQSEFCVVTPITNIVSTIVELLNQNLLTSHDVLHFRQDVNYECCTKQFCWFLL